MPDKPLCYNNSGSPTALNSKGDVLKELGKYSLTLNQLETGDRIDLPSVYYISGTNENESKFSIQGTKEAVMLQLYDAQPIEWQIASDDVLAVAVLDHYTNSIVCMKSFRYVEESLALME